MNFSWFIHAHNLVRCALCALVHSCTSICIACVHWCIEIVTGKWNDVLVRTCALVRFSVHLRSSVMRHACHVHVHAIFVRMTRACLVHACMSHVCVQGRHVSAGRAHHGVCLCCCNTTGLLVFIARSSLHRRRTILFAVSPKRFGAHAIPSLAHLLQEQLVQKFCCADCLSLSMVQKM